MREAKAIQTMGIIAIIIIVHPYIAHFRNAGPFNALIDIYYYQVCPEKRGVLFTFVLVLQCKKSLLYCTVVPCDTFQPIKDPFWLSTVS